MDVAESCQPPGQTAHFRPREGLPISCEGLTAAPLPVPTLGEPGQGAGRQPVPKGVQERKLGVWKLKIVRTSPSQKSMLQGGGMDGSNSLLVSLSHPSTLVCD